MHVAERAEIEAMRDAYAAAPEDVAGRYGIGLADVGGALCLSISALPGVTYFNRALGLGLERETAEEDVDAICRHYAAVETTAFVAVAPEARPAGLSDMLERRGLTPGYPWEKFTRPPDPGIDVETDLAVERIDASRAHDFGRVVAESFGLPLFTGEWVAGIVGRPGWSCYLALDGDEPAACAALHVAGDVGWLGIGGALPEFRGRGAQRALIAARVRDAAELGARVVVTETGVPEDGRPSFSHRNILRSGFEPVYVRPNYVTPG